MAQNVDMKKTAPTIAEAVAQLLSAMGLDPGHSDLLDTPQRVEELWSKEFLSGYQLDPAALLGSPIQEEQTPDAVFITDLTYHSMCPHHLLPTQGRAHVAYIPDRRLIGFGRVAELVACFAQRLTLQERATHQVAQALVDHLPALGAGCVVEAEHSCLSIPDDKHQSSRVVTAAYVGQFKERPDLQGQLMAAVRPAP